MHEFNQECNVCEACGFCERTESECIAYREFFGLGDITAKDHIGNTQNAINYLNGQIVEIVEGHTTVKITFKSDNNYISSIMPIGDFSETHYSIGDIVNFAFKQTSVKLI